ncbi:MAG TPA: hypothetical protein VGL46_10950 [Pseudonocardiaceae bacterium]|jgi:hypothetical protein
MGADSDVAAVDPGQAGVRGEHVVDAASQCAELGRPVAGDGGQLDLAEHEIDHEVDELIFVADVVVQRHRGDLQFGGRGPHGQRGKTVLVD